jgi:glycosyltransferase involved in cell wall biosynthesis
MNDGSKVVIVMPAFKAEKTLEKTVEALPAAYRGRIILVDDRSPDSTVEISRKLGIETIVHEKNSGYGAAQKTCYRKALEARAGIVVMIHPDYQYNPGIIPAMVSVISENVCDIVLGNRIRTRREALGGGMPLYKYLINRVSTIFENFIFGQNLGEWHSGLRAYSRRALETIPWEKNSDDFVFDQQMLIQATHFGLRVGDIPVPTKYFPEASSINFIRSVEYGIETLYFIARYFFHRIGLLKCDLLEQPR